MVLLMKKYIVLLQHDFVQVKSKASKAHTFLFLRFTVLWCAISIQNLLVYAGTGLHYCPCWHSFFIFAIRAKSRNEKEPPVQYV